MQNLETILQDVINITKQAGEAVLSYYDKDYKVQDKDDNSPVTEADLKSNEILLEALKKYNYGILSEEGVPDLSRLKAERVWIIDPLDGTKDFIDKTGEFTIMVGLVEKINSEENKYRPILGVIYQPTTNDIYFAVKNKGAYVRHGAEEKRPLQISLEKNWQNITMLTSRHHSTDLEMKIAKKLGISKIANYGSSLKACMVAKGEGHINFNSSDKTWEWDVCASDIILSEAGGRLTDTKGNVIYYNKENPRNQNGYLVTNRIIHDEIVEEIKENK